MPILYTPEIRLMASSSQIWGGRQGKTKGRYRREGVRGGRREKRGWEGEEGAGGGRRGGGRERRGREEGEERKKGEMEKEEKLRARSVHHPKKGGGRQGVGGWGKGREGERPNPPPPSPPPHILILNSDMSDGIIASLHAVLYKKVWWLVSWA